VVFREKIFDENFGVNCSHLKEGDFFLRLKVKLFKLEYEILRPDKNGWNGMLEDIEYAARVCYRSEDKVTLGSDKKLVKKLIDNGHLAMLEHAPNISVLFHVDRGISHEIVRHRLASFAQSSTRYCNYAKDKFGHEISLAPMMDGLTGDQIARRHDLWRHIEQVYMAEINEGIKPQQARDNLPNCLLTDIVVTTNIRHWREIFRQRTEKHAHPQMRKLMNRLLNDFRSRTPILFDTIKRASPFL